VALIVGVRGVPVADLCRPLAGWADVVVLTAKDIMAQRHDAVDRSLPVRDVVLAPGAAGLVDTAVEYARTHRIDGAFTVSEDAIEVTAEFAAAAGLPGQPVSTVAAFRDKYLQRRLLAAAGVPVPPYAELTGPESVGAALARVPLPAILKPTRASGGALAYVVTAAEQLPELLAEALRQVGSAGGAVESHTAFLLEGLLVGVDSHPVPGFAPYVSVETLASSGRYHHLAVTDRFPVSPPALETGMMLPSCLAPEQRERLLVAAEAALRALGFQHGAAHTELMLTADGPRVIEVNARVGGALPYLFPMASDLDLIEQVARVAVGLPPSTVPTFHGHAVFVAPQHPVGVHVEAVEGFAEIAALPGVRAVFPVSTGGARTDAFNDTMIAAVLGTVPDAASAVALWHDVMRTIRPRYSSTEVPDHYRRTPAEATPHVLPA
jgi:biotin carboxylase